MLEEYLEQHEAEELRHFNGGNALDDDADSDVISQYDPIAPAFLAEHDYAKPAAAPTPPAELDSAERAAPTPPEELEYAESAAPTPLPELEEAQSAAPTPPAEMEREAPAAPAAPPVPAQPLRLENHRWGPFRVTFKVPQGSRFGGWQIECPFHAKSERTKCRKFTSIVADTVEAQTGALNALKLWAVEAKSHNRQWKHIMQPALLPATAPNEAALAALMPSMEGWVTQTDDILEAREAAAGRARGKQPADRRVMRRASARPGSSRDPPAAPPSSSDELGSFSDEQRDEAAAAAAAAASQAASVQPLAHEAEAEGKSMVATAKPAAKPQPRADAAEGRGFSSNKSNSSSSTSSSSSSSTSSD